MSILIEFYYIQIDMDLKILALCRSVWPFCDSGVRALREVHNFQMGYIHLGKIKHCTALYTWQQVSNLINS